MEQFENNYVTQLNGSINDSTTTIIVDAGPTDITASFRIKIDDELIMVGSVSSTTFSSCTRGIEGTTAASHADNAVVEHVLTAGSLKYGLGSSNFLESYKITADTPDDEFDSTSLAGKWTAVSGSSGTVNLLETGNVARYDLTTRPGWLLMQVGSTATQEVLLRQDYTIPVDSSIVVAVLPSINGETATADELQIGISLNSNDTDFDAGATSYAFYAVEMDTVPDIQTISVGQSAGGSGRVLAAGTWGMSPIGQVVYLRIARDSNNWYYPSFSFNGFVWQPLGASQFTNPHDNLWIFARNAATSGAPVPIQAVAWVRLGGVGIDPWPWL